MAITLPGFDSPPDPTGHVDRELLGKAAAAVMARIGQIKIQIDKEPGDTADSLAKIGACREEISEIDTLIRALNARWDELGRPER